MTKHARSQARVRETARALFQACVRQPARRLRAQGGGLTNHVFTVDTREGSFVLRMSSEPGKLEDFRKERWVIDHARRAHLPAPKVLRVGTATDGTAFMLARREPGRPATELGDVKPVLTQLGRYARALHRIELDSYGGACGDEGSRWRSWAEFLQHEFRLDARLQQLREHRMIDMARARRLGKLVRALGEGRRPQLNHGDLRLKNVLVDGSGRIGAILDWECAIAAPAPEWDLALALHDLAIDDKDAFMEGYGLDEQSSAALGPTLAALNMLLYAPFVEKAARTGDDLCLARFRRRFARVYDLYSA